MVRTKFERVKPHCNIGTTGHVGHDKTTLTAAVTKVPHNKYSDPNELSPFDGIDKAPEECQYGITISIAHVGYRTEGRHYVHVDRSGHADYVKGMIIGVVQVDGAILVMAATSGPMAQTHEHILLARQVGVPAIVVALDKCNTIAEEDADLIDLVEMELREIPSTREFDDGNLPTVRVAAFPAPDGDKKRAGTVLEPMDVADEYIPQPEHDTEKPFLTSTEDVFTITGRDTVITGRIECGIVKTDDTADFTGIRPEKQTTTVTDVEVFRRTLDEGRTDENVSLLFCGTKKEDTGHDMVVIKPGSTTPCTDFEATVHIPNREEGGRHRLFFSDYSLQFYFYTINVTGVVRLPKGKEVVMPGDNIDTTVHLNKLIAVEENLKFVIREGGYTVSAGKVTKIIK